MIMRRVLLALLVSTSLAHAQDSPPTPALRTVPAPVKITTGLTFQQLLPAVPVNSLARRSLTIENNNATDSCNIIIGGPWAAGDTTSTARTINSVSLTGAQASILLLAAGSYTRYYPYTPGDIILGTCTSTGDSLYVDTQ
jgi:hypothetical protein